MRFIKEKTVLAAVSELRTELNAILRQLREGPVVLEKHHRPVAILELPQRHAALRKAAMAASESRRRRIRKNA